MALNPNLALFFQILVLNVVDYRIEMLLLLVLCYGQTAGILVVFLRINESDFISLICF